MARFEEGQRVKVPQFRPSTEIHLHVKEGVVTLVASADTTTESGNDEQQYLVKFDGEVADRPMFEGQLEAI